MLSVAVRWLRGCCRPLETTAGASWTLGLLLAGRDRWWLWWEACPARCCPRFTYDLHGEPSWTPSPRGTRHLIIGVCRCLSCRNTQINLSIINSQVPGGTNRRLRVRACASVKVIRFFLLLGEIRDHCSPLVAYLYRVWSWSSTDISTGHWY